MLDDIAFFESFHSGLSGWSSDGASWTSAGDAVNGSAETTGGFYFATGSSWSSGAFSAEIVFNYTGAEPVSNPSTTSVLFSVQEDGGDTWWWACTLIWNTGYLTVDRFDENVTGPWPYDTVESVASGDNGPREGVWHRIRVYYDGANDLRCYFNNENGDSAAINVDGAELWPDMSGYGGLWINYEDVDFESFIVYD